MIPFLLFLSVDVANMDRDDRLLFECRAETRDLKPGDAIAKWLECDAKAEERGLDELRPVLQGYALEAQLERDYAKWKKNDPVAWSKVVLGTAANRPEVELPAEAVRDAWLTLIKDHHESVKLEKVSSVTVRWISQLQEEEQAELDEQVRRYLLDRGWRVPEPDSYEAGESAIIIMATPRIEHTAWEGDETLKITRISIQTEDLRYKRMDLKGRPIAVSAEHQDNNRDTARHVAFQEVGQDFADALMRDVVRHLYRGYEVPLPPK